MKTDPTQQHDSAATQASVQAENCRLRLCCRDDAHAPGCTTYDPARLATRDAEPDAPMNVRLAMEQARYALKEASSLYSLGFNVRHAPEDGAKDETGVTKAEYETAADGIRESITMALDMLRSVLDGEPVDPLDTRLPCDITVGGMTIRKGCRLRTVVTRMESLHRMAMRSMPQVTPEQQRANFQTLFPHEAPNEMAPAPRAITDMGDNDAAN